MADKSTYGKRADGSAKGLGYFGEVKAKSGKSFSTELGVNEEIDGEDVHYPLIYPGMTRQELDHLVNGGKPTNEMYDKARGHAMARIAAGKSPFAEEGEQQELPKEATPDEDGYRIGYDKGKKK